MSRNTTSNLIKEFDEDYKKTIDSLYFEPNKLTNDEVKELCLDFYNGIFKNVLNKPIPKIEVIEEYKRFKTGIFPYTASQIINIYIDKLNFETKYQYSNYNYYYNPLKNYADFIHTNNSIAGIIQRTRVLNRIYSILNNPPNITNKKIKKFLELYIKALDILAIYYNAQENIFYAIKKPNKWVLEEDNKMYCCYPENENYFFGKIEVPKWLYTTPAEELNPKDLLLLNNADVRSEFVKKIGINRLIELGTVIDTYKNYPDNEMWAKSEYKIIDMSALKIPKVIRDNIPIEYFDYAPYLYMKNQTTGVYHLEGIHPDCHTLYDAIKMRYNGICIEDFELKDIK